MIGPKKICQSGTAWAEKYTSSSEPEQIWRNDRFVFLAGLRYREDLVPHIRHWSVPMEDWLGRFHPDERVRRVGLWNIQGVNGAALNPEGVRALLKDACRA